MEKMMSVFGIFMLIYLFVIYPVVQTLLLKGHF